MSKKKIYYLSRHGNNLLKTNAVIFAENKKRYQKVSLLLDTGSSFTILPQKILEQLGYNLQNPIRYKSITTGKGNTQPLPMIKINTFNCLGQKIENFEVIVYDLPSNLQVNGLLGMDFLTTRKAIINLYKTELYFQE